MNKKEKNYGTIISMFLTFLKIGAFTFGGGYAMIAIIEHEIVENKKWINKEGFLDIIALAESTPGPIAINSATYIGYKVGGVLGSAAATLGVVLPSFVIIFAVSLIFDKFLKFKYVDYAFRGIQACVVYLICSAGIKMFRSLEKNTFNILTVCLVVVAMTVITVLSINFSSVYIILICGVLGLGVYYGKKVLKKDNSKEDKNDIS